jgi:hypothetical protein
MSGKLGQVSHAVIYSDNAVKVGQLGVACQRIMSFRFAPVNRHMPMESFKIALWTTSCSSCVRWASSLHGVLSTALKCAGDIEADDNSESTHMPVARRH